MTPQEARERAAHIHATRAGTLPNDDCPTVKQGCAIYVAHECGRSLEFIANVA